MRLLQCFFCRRSPRQRMYEPQEISDESSFIIISSLPEEKRENPIKLLSYLMLSFKILLEVLKYLI